MIGKRVSHYQLIEPLGKGGMGVVYKAEDLRLGRFVALKFLKAEIAASRDALERFQREARAASALNHPHICTIHDIGEDAGMYFLVMELLKGETLQQRLARGPLKGLEILEFGTQISDALDAAHATEIVHRDIKPSNIFITDRGLCKILDFGLAKLAPSGHPSENSLRDSSTRLMDPDLTNPGSVVGTIHYMSPEQACAEEVDHRSDIFCFGALLYEMATGEKAFAGTTSALVFDSILNRTPVSTSIQNPDLPAALDTIIFKALEKERRLRYQSAAEIRDDLIGLRTGLESGWTPSMTARFAPRRKRSVAVLPFIDMSPERDQEYFCDGIAEEIINALANIEGLQITPRISTFQLKGKTYDSRTIGRQLKVDSLLEGSLRKAGDQVRITAQLIDVQADACLWSERYDRRMDDIFAIQEDIGRAIVEKLRIEMRDGHGLLVKRPTDNPEAYNLYLKGRFYWNRRYEGGVQKGIEFFQKAIERDPNYAIAYSGLADSYSILATYGFLPTHAALPKAKDAAEKAVRLDDSLAEAHSSLGFVRLFYDWDWSGAERELKFAIELNPSYVVARYWYAMHLAVLMRFPEAIKEVERARDLDPLNHVTHIFVGWVSFLRHDYDAAIVALRSAIELEPNSHVALSFIAMAYAHKARFDEALESITKAIELTMRANIMLQGLATVLALAGRTNEAYEALQSVIDSQPARYVSPFYMSCSYAAIGNTALAVEWLERGLAERDGAMFQLQVFPELESLHQHPAYLNASAKMRFSPAAVPQLPTPSR